jgi:Secretion system C-terminal sorting domain
MLTELNETWSNDAWVNNYRWTSTYDNSGHVLSVFAEIWSDSAWANLYRFTYNYDNSGNLLTELDEVWSDIAWVNSELYTYTYDNSGNRLTELDVYWSNNGWVNNRSFAYAFDNNGNCIHGESLIWQDSAWVKYKTSIQLLYNHNQNFIYFSAAVVDLEYTSITGIASEQLNLLSYNLQQNYPNPFNPNTTINFSLAKEGHVKLTVYNSIGSKVATIVDEYKPAGNYSIQFNGSRLASGIYVYRLETDNYSAAKKFILMK